MDGYILTRNELAAWIDNLADTFTVHGPVSGKYGQTVFRHIDNSKELVLDYGSTMMPPRVFIHPPHQSIFTADRENGTITPAETGGKPQILLGVHPCDVHAIALLDRVFRGETRDPLYAAQREATCIVAINCTAACDPGFCRSMHTGPFLNLQPGGDIEITLLADACLIEVGSRKGADLLNGERGAKARPADFLEKQHLEQKARASFKKHVDTRGLPELLARNQHHPVFRETAESRCLSCANCTLVCPTCYCYNIVDTTAFDLKSVERTRHWDSCQECDFARVHEDNFRSSREARLRQFVTHKLSSWLDQYGAFGCVGCGRCMTWCPTGIDLIEIVKRIQDDQRDKRPI